MNKLSTWVYPTLALSIFNPVTGEAQGSKNALKRPNVIFVFADQWRAQATGFSGDENVITPFMDKLAAESIVFSTAVSNTPVCCPYRASLLTGQYPLTHGIFMNDASLNPEVNSMGKIFKAAGYNTAYIGKWHLDGHGRSSYIPPERRQGFDYWKVLECTHNYNNSPYYANNDTFPSKWPGYDAYFQTQDAQDYIRNHTHAEKPFLLVLSWGPPHDPYQTAPEDYKEKYRNRDIKLRPNVSALDSMKATTALRGYYAHINALDDCLGMLLKTIDQGGIAENTVFIFTSDHGDMLYSHGGTNKQQPYDESILVPFLLRYPKIHGNQKRIIDTPINTPDILPTLLGICNINIPKSIEGLDFSKLVKGEKTLTENQVLISSITPFGQWNRKRGGTEYRGIRTTRYTYVRNLKGPWLLFDNKTDPYQLNNLIGNPEFAGLEGTLEKNLQQKLKETNDTFLPGESYIEKWGYVTDDSGTIPYKN